MPSGRGEGPSYMKVPYIESPFKVTSIHHCTVFGVGNIQNWEGHKNAFVCICTSVSMCILSKSSKTLYETPEEEKMYEKFLILVFRDFGVGTKFEQKLKFVY